MNKQHKKLISDIRNILVKDWDPINIGNNPNLYDEYDGYIGTLIKMLSQKCTVENIIVFLEKTEKETMGLDNINIDVLRKVALELKKIGYSYYK